MVAIGIALSLLRPQLTDERKPVTLEAKGGSIVIGPPVVVSSKVTDFAISEDGSAVVYGRRVLGSLDPVDDKPRKVDVVYADLKAGKSVVLVSGAEEDDLRYGARFAFLGSTSKLVYFLDPGPWVEFHPCISCDPSGYPDGRRVTAIWRIGPGEIRPTKIDAEALGPGEELSLSAFDRMPGVCVTVTRDYARTDPPPSQPDLSLVQELLIDEAGRLRQVALSAPLGRMFPCEWDADHRSLILSGSDRKFDVDGADNLKLTIRWDTGAVTAEPIKPPPTYVSDSGEISLRGGGGLVPDGIDFLPYMPNPIVWVANPIWGRARDLRLPYALRWQGPNWTPENQNGVHPMWIEYMTRESLKTFLLAKDVDDYHYNKTGRVIALMSGATLTVRRIDVRNAQGH